MIRPKNKRSPLAKPGPPPSVADLYDQHPGEISVLMGWFFLRHLNQLYRNFRGDLLLPMVLGEIAHHNVCHYFSSGKAKAASKGKRVEIMEPCNPFSLSVATGLPRETCRRKVQILVRQGLVRKHAAGGYIITPGLRAKFREANQETLADLLALIGDLEEILGPAVREHLTRKAKGGQG